MCHGGIGHEVRGRNLRAATDARHGQDHEQTKRMKEEVHPRTVKPSGQRLQGGAAKYRHLDAARLPIERMFIYFADMARPKGSNADITGPRVRAAALRLFARDGYAAVSMRQIAAEVGVQAGALYLYTPDKQALLFDLLDSHMRDLIAAYDAEVLAPDPMVRMAHFVRFHIGRNLDHPAAVFLSYMELRNLTPDNFAAIEALRRAYEDRLARILADGQAARQFAVADVRLATMAIIAMLNGVNTWFRDGGRLSRSEVEAIHCDMVRKALSA